MKHCKNCSRCQEDLLSRYIIGFAEYKCMLDHHPIQDAFWDGRDCAFYKKDNFKKESIGDFLYKILEVAK